MSHYLATRSDEEIRLYIKNQYRTITDVQIYYIDKMKHLFFTDNNRNVYSTTTHVLNILSILFFVIGSIFWIIFMYLNLI